MKGSRADLAAVLTIPSFLLFYAMASMRIRPDAAGLLDHTAFILLFIWLFLSAGKVGRLAWTAFFALFFTGEVLYFRFFASWAHSGILLHSRELPIAFDGIQALLRPPDLILGLALPVSLAWAARSTQLGPAPRSSVRIAVGVLLCISLRATFASSTPRYAQNNPFFYLFRQALRNARMARLDAGALARIAAEADRYQPLRPGLYTRSGGSQYPFERTPLPDAPAPELRAGKSMNVVLVLLESVRAFESGAYGANPSFTPNLDRLAREARLYKNFYANAAQTTRSEFSILSSYVPNYAGGSTYLRNPRQSIVTLPAILQGAGYRTMWISSYPPSFGNKKAFLSRHGIESFHSTYGSGLPRLGPGASDEDLYGFALDLLDRQPEPFFAEIMTLSNHFPFTWDYPTIAKTPPAKGDKLFRAYTQGVFYTDTALGKFIADVRDRPWAKDTLFVITGDHGTMHFPGDIPLDNAARQELFFRVPMLLWSPGNIPPGVDSRLASHLDIAPTVLDYLGIRATNSFLGASLLRPPGKEDFVFMLHDERWNFRTGNEYLYDVETEQYNDHFPFRPESERNFHTPAHHAGFSLMTDLLRDHSPTLRVPLPPKRKKQLEDFSDESLTAYLLTNLQDRISRPLPPEMLPDPHPHWIAHAGGEVGGEIYTNSLEALEKNYHERGHRFFELDFSLAMDGEYVLLHDWDQDFPRLFGRKGPVTAAEFARLKMKGGRTPMTDRRLMKWLVEHPDAHIVTDVKSDNHRALNMLWRKDPALIDRFIAQIYHMGEYEKVRYLGYNRIILTLYRSSVPDELILKFAGIHELFAVTMPAEKALQSDLPLKLRDQGVFVYAHTVNDPQIAAQLAARGVGGFYTDTLGPDKHPLDPLGNTHKSGYNPVR